MSRVWEDLTHLTKLRVPGNLQYYKMYMIKHLSLALLTLGIILMMNTHPAFAQTPTPTCQTVYGGGVTCNVNGTLAIDKTVENPQTGSFTNNLLQDEYIFGTAENITFRITITNTTSGNISNIHILDTLPTNLDYVSSDGTFNSQTRTVSIPDATLASKASTSFLLKTKVNTQPLPGNQSTVCLSNTAQAQTTSFFFFNNTQSQDAAIFCLKTSAGPTTTPTPINSQMSSGGTTTPSQQTRGGKPVYRAPNASQTPPTGPVTTSLMLLPFLFILGKFLQRKAMSY